MIYVYYKMKPVESVDLRLSRHEGLLLLFQLQGYQGQPNKAYLQCRLFQCFIKTAVALCKLPSFRKGDARLLRVMVDVL
jgi:hypothetical protein